MKYSYYGIDSKIEKKNFQNMNNSKTTSNRSIQQLFDCKKN